jgi:monoamine oxidase
MPSTAHTKSGSEDDEAMLDVAIIGGGLCGLALAHSLQARQLNWSLFEARTRLGGRVLTQRGAQGQALDLGPGWYWPSTQPSMTRLVNDLGLATLEQPDDGRVLWLDDPNRAARVMAMDANGKLSASGTPMAGALHGGARRLAGGMQALVEALQARLPAARMQVGWALHRVQDAGDHVVLHLKAQTPSGAALQIRARRVVLALPPRVAASGISFQPELPKPLMNAMQATPTWMATAAKTAAAYARPFWRDGGHNGNACVRHPQAVLAEVFDTSPALASTSTTGATGTAGALGGFLAMGVAARQGIAPRSMQLLVESQLTMLYGQAAADGDLHLQDWACEAWTCTEQDRAEDAAGAGNPPYGLPELAGAQWNGRLYFGGSETAARSGGYLEGALNAAARLRKQLDEAQAELPTA